MTRSVRARSRRPRSSSTPGGTEGPGSREVQAATQRLISSLEADPEVARVTFDEQSPQFVDAGRRYYRIEAAGKSDYGASRRSSSSIGCATT